MKKVLKNKKGFTLVELMVVVAILGVLVAVAVPAYNGITDSANEKVCAANIRTIESAILQAQVDGVTFTKNSTKPIDEVLVNAVGNDGTARTYITGAADLRCPSDAENKYQIAVDANGVVTVVACGAH